MLVGYARVSTYDKNLDLQKNALAQAGCEKVFMDHISGAASERPGLEEAVAYVREGDTLVVWRLDRLGRSLRHLIDLVGHLEEKGIGRPSTYAAILSTIQDRKYAQKTDGRFSPTELGTVVNDFLVDKFADVLDIGFTASMEDKLDSIEDGKMKWIKVVKDFYKPFNRDLDEATKATDRVKPQDIPTETNCEKCGKPMVIRWGRHGRFLACSGFPECKNAGPLEGEANQAEALATDEKCPKCGSPMVLKAGRFGKFFACSKYPECKTTKPIATGVKCPEDGGDIIERRSKKGKVFWSCSNYPECKFASWYKPVPLKCPQCGADFLFEKRGKTGTITRECPKKDCGHKEEVTQLEEVKA